jgi:predicted DNA repair protein MutK
LFLLPGALFLSFVAAWAITPLLMLGGAYLCYEGAEKVWNALAPHGANEHGAATLALPQGPQALENAKVRGAIGTDLILSAEIMAITLGALANLPLWEQAVVLAIVGTGITLGVYGVVALIVKADDAGVAMAAGERPVSAILGRRKASPSGADRAIRPVTQAIGRGLVVGVPWLLQYLAIVGTAAMVWVGGGIIVHGLAGYGLEEIEHAIEGSAAASAATLPLVSGLAGWMVTAASSGLVGLSVGATLIAAMRHAIAPVVSAVRNRRAVRRTV